MHRTKEVQREALNEKGQKIKVTVLTHQYTNNCGFCGKECGFVTFDTERPELEESLEPLGYVDTRCDDCLAEQGEFKG